MPLPRLTHPFAAAAVIAVLTAFAAGLAPPRAHAQLSGVEVEYEISVSREGEPARTWQAALRGNADLHRVEFEIPRVLAQEEASGESGDEEAPEPETFWLVVDREQERLSVVFPPTKLVQTIELEKLNAEDTPLALGFFALGELWLERLREAAGDAGEAEEGEPAEGMFRIESLGTRTVAGAEGSAFRLGVPGAAGMEVVFSSRWGFPLELSAALESAEREASLSAVSVREAELSRSELTGYPDNFEVLTANKPGDLILLHLFERLAESPELEKGQ